MFWLLSQCLPRTNMTPHTNQCLEITLLPAGPSPCWFHPCDYHRNLYINSWWFIVGCGGKNPCSSWTTKKNPPSEDLDSVIGDPDPAPGDTIELRKCENLGAAVGKPGFHCADWQTESWSVAKREEEAPCMKTWETECRLHALRSSITVHLWESLLGT